MGASDTLPAPRRYGFGIDWITLTWLPESYMFEAVKWRYDELLHSLAGAVDGQKKMVEWKQFGYAGWRLGKWRVGWRADGCILVVSSLEAANYAWIPYLDEARCTRIDIKADLHYDYPRPYILQTIDTMSFLCAQASKHRPYDQELHQPERAPHWFEAGSRDSDLYLRVYDKEAESDQDPAYEGVWRIEMEVKKEPANEIFHAIRRRGNDAQSVRDWALALFAKRGIRLAGVRPGEWYIVPVSPRPDRDVDRTLGWLRKVVRPAIAKLLTEIPIGDIMDALELYQDGHTEGENYG